MGTSGMNPTDLHLSNVPHFLLMEMRVRHRIKGRKRSFDQREPGPRSRPPIRGMDSGRSGNRGGRRHESCSMTTARLSIE